MKKGVGEGRDFQSIIKYLMSILYIELMVMRYPCTENLMPLELLKTGGKQNHVLDYFHVLRPQENRWKKTPCFGLFPCLEAPGTILVKRLFLGCWNIYITKNLHILSISKPDPWKQKSLGKWLMEKDGYICGCRWTSHLLY